VLFAINFKVPKMRVKSEFFEFFEKNHKNRLISAKNMNIEQNDNKLCFQCLEMQNVIWLYEKLGGK
jgi:hypothetical protein